jgi:hypothetical protein
MNQALYAHMNNKRKMKKKYKEFSILKASFIEIKFAFHEIYSF